MSEVRTRNAETGGEKGQKLERFDLIPVRPLTELATHYGKGRFKYADRNWEKGYEWSLTYAALMRHITAWWGGEDIDPDFDVVDDDGYPLDPPSHLAAVAWHAFALMEYAHTHPEMDNRSPSVEARKRIEGELRDLELLRRSTAQSVEHEVREIFAADPAEREDLLQHVWDDDLSTYRDPTLMEDMEQDPRCASCGRDILGPLSRYNTCADCIEENGILSGPVSEGEIEGVPA